MAVKEKIFYYFIGDAFSLELLDFLKSHTSLTLVPVSQNQELNSENAEGIIYTPSLNLKELAVLEQLPSRVKKMAVLDLFHFDFCDFLESFKQISPDLVFSPRELPCNVKEIVIIPSFIKMIYSQIKSIEPINQHDLCFISQPLQEERNLDFNQYELALECRNTLQKVAPERKIYIKPHPREDISRFQDLQLFQESPMNTLKHFKFFVGYNSAMLYAAQGLERNVQMFSHPSCVKPELLRDLFLSTHREILPQIQDGLNLFISKL